MESLNVAYFLSFCIEQYKRREHLSGSDAVQLLCRYGILEYLYANYGVLHTQSSQWLMEEIDELIDSRKEHEQ